LGGLDHGDADAVLDRPKRIEVLQLGDDRGPGVADHAAQAHQRRVADRLRDVIVNPTAERLDGRHGGSSRWGNGVTVSVGPRVGEGGGMHKSEWTVKITVVSEK